MRKASILMALSVVAGVASAALYTENFDALSLTSSDTITNPVTTVSSSGGIWYEGGSTIISSGELQFARAGGSGGWSGASFVLDSTVLNTGAGTYTLEFDFTFANHDSGRIFAEVWEANAGAGEYVVKNVGYGGWDRSQPNVVSIANGASATLLNGLIIGRLADYGTQSLDFVYDGSSDIVISVGGGRNSTGWSTVRMDNLQVIPEPATLGAIAMSGGAILFIRRKFMV